MSSETYGHVRLRCLNNFVTSILNLSLRKLKFNSVYLWRAILFLENWIKIDCKVVGREFNIFRSVCWVLDNFSLVTTIFYFKRICICCDSWPQRIFLTALCVNLVKFPDSNQFHIKYSLEIGVIISKFNINFFQLLIFLLKIPCLIHCEKTK